MENYPLLKSQDMLTYSNPFTIKNIDSGGNITVNAGEGIEVITIYQPDFLINLNNATYSWQQNGVELSTAKIFIPETSGSYSVIITYDGATYNLSFNVTLDISATITDVSILNYDADLPMSNSGDTIDLSAQYTCSIPCTVTWILKSNKGTTTETTLGTGNSFTLNINEGNNEDIIYCKVSNEYSEVNSQELKIHTVIGSGTETDPYLIFNSFDWNYYAESCRNTDTKYNFNLMKDITEVGYLKQFINCVNVFDGNGCTISGMLGVSGRVTQYDTGGLFYDTSNDETLPIVKNLGFIDITYTLTSSNTMYMPLIINEGTLLNCFTENLNVTVNCDSIDDHNDLIEFDGLSKESRILKNCYMYNTTVSYTKNYGRLELPYDITYVAPEYDYQNNYIYKISVNNLPNNSELGASKVNGLVVSNDANNVTGAGKLIVNNINGNIAVSQSVMESESILDYVGDEYYFDTETNHARLNIFNRQLNPSISFPYTSPKIITDTDLASGELSIIFDNLPKNTNYSIVWKKDGVELTDYRNCYHVPYSVLNDGEIYSNIEVVVTTANGGTTSTSILLNPELVLEEIPVADTNVVYINSYESKSIDLSDYIITNISLSNLTFEVEGTSDTGDFMSYTNLNGSIFTILSSPYDVETTIDLTFKVYVTGFESSGDINISVQLKLGFFPSDIEISGMNDYYIVLPEEWDSNDGHTINFVLNQSNSNRISTPYNLKVTRLDGYDNTLLDTIINGSRNTNYVYESFSSAYRYEYNKNIYKFEISNDYGSFTKELKFNINIGNGSADAPLLIFDADDMLHIKDFITQTNIGINSILRVHQMNHLDFSGYGKMNRLIDLDNISMNYNGNNYKIENLYLEAGNKNHVGMFQNVGDPFVIDNIEICNCTLDINNSGVTLAGLLFSGLDTNITMMSNIIIHDIDIVDTNNNSSYPNASVGLISGTVNHDSPYGYLQQQGYISNITMNTGKIQNFGYVYGTVLMNYGGFDGYYIHDIYNINAVNCGVIGNWESYTWKDYSTDHAYICSSTISFLSSDTNVGEEFTEITETQITDGTLLGNLNYGGDMWYASENGLPKPIRYNPLFRNYQSPYALPYIIDAVTTSLKFVYLDVQYPGFYKPWKVEVQNTEYPDSSSNINGNELYVISVDNGGTLRIKLTNSDGVSRTLTDIPITVG